MLDKANHEDWYLELPASGNCLLVDSRFSSRRTFFNLLTETKLFLNVVEAESLEDAQTRLIGGWFDACLIGPSVKQKPGAGLVEDMHKRMPASKCALIVFTNSKEKTSEEVYKWAHKVCQVPGTQSELAETLVIAVLCANNQSIWKDTVFQLRPSLFEEVRAWGLNRQQLIAASKDGTIKGAAVKFSITNVMNESIEILERLIDAYNGSSGAIGNDGKVKPSAIIDVRTATDKLFAGFMVNKEISSFKNYFATVLLETLIKVPIEGKEEAVKNFRKSILSESRRY